MQLSQTNQELSNSIPEGKHQHFSQMAGIHRLVRELFYKSLIFDERKSKSESENNYHLVDMKKLMSMIDCHIDQPPVVHTAPPKVSEIEVIPTEIISAPTMKPLELKIGNCDFEVVFEGESPMTAPLQRSLISRSDRIANAKSSRANAMQESAKPNANNKVKLMSELSTVLLHRVDRKR